MNHQLIHWPPTIGIMALSLITSMLLIVFTALFPEKSGWLIKAVTSIDFHSLLMNSMLGFLLFAGSIQIEAKEMRKERFPIIVLATIGILIATFVVGSMLYYCLYLLHFPVPYIYCLLFAALISPTDPIAILAILKRAGIEKSLEVKIAGESLFNDGVAVVVFLTILHVAQSGSAELSAPDIFILFFREAGGGLLFGAILGYTGLYLTHAVDKYEVQVAVSIAIVMGGYLFADKMQVSGPLAMVVAGIVMGAKTQSTRLSVLNRDYFNKFWELIDELLNAILFMLVGLEMLAIKMNAFYLLMGSMTIVIVLLARWVSVAVPVSVLRYRVAFEKNAIAILTWGGLRGGLSIALALSLPTTMFRDFFVSITYIVVIFSVIIQGLSIGKVHQMLSGRKGTGLKREGQ